jgi:hypothetical protein
MAYSFKVKDLEEKFHLRKVIQNDGDGTTGTTPDSTVLDVETIDQYIENLRSSCRKREQLDAIQSYFEGTVSIDDDGSALWYGLEKYIDNYGGVFLRNEAWYPSSDPPFWTMSTAKMFDLNVYANSIDNEKVRLPTPDDFPMVWIIHRDDFEEAKNEFEKIESIPIEMKNQFLEWINCGYCNQHDLVLYYY